jgi:hypothetical protein
MDRSFIVPTQYIIPSRRLNSLYITGNYLSSQRNKALLMLVIATPSTTKYVRLLLINTPNSVNRHVYTFYVTNKIHQ